uniref:2-nitropropane dioxygenase n=1 Tax=Mycena chlorophos TaxID=658473 RepID=A0ABQ0LES5_MYCCL|nr:2-nitropropane dioxygenase [Mycena chlorophos]
MKENLTVFKFAEATLAPGSQHNDAVLKTPIISAPMLFAATPEMAAAVTNGGGLGFGTYATFDSTAVIKEKIAAIRKLLGITHETPSRFGSRSATLASTSSKFASTTTKRDTHDFYFRSSRVLGRRSSLCALSRLPRYSSMEAGGHARSDDPPLLTLFQTVTNSLPQENRPLLVAAGGIATGAQIVGLLTMGASGVVLGTRFLFTPECEYGPTAKEALLAAGLNGTVRTLAYDDVGRTNGMDDVEASLSLEERLAKFAASKAVGDVSRIVVWAGVGVGLVNDIRPTAEVLEELHEEAFKHLHASANMLVL